MNRLIFATTLALLSSAVFSQPVLAQQSCMLAGAQAKVKSVNFQLRNQSDGPLLLNVGGQFVSFRPGETRKIKTDEGARITNVNATAHLAPGQLIVVAARAFEGDVVIVG